MVCFDILLIVMIPLKLSHLASSFIPLRSWHFCFLVYVLLVCVSWLHILKFDVLSSEGMPCSFTEKSEAIEDGAGISGMYALLMRRYFSD